MRLLPQINHTSLKGKQNNWVDSLPSRRLPECMTLVPNRSTYTLDLCRRGDGGKGNFLMDRTEFVLHVSDMSEIINVEASTLPQSPLGRSSAVINDLKGFSFYPGSSPGHSPVLNLSKSGSGERERSDRDRDRERVERGEGSASGRSSAASRRTPQPPRIPSTAAAVSPRSHTDESDAALSDQDDHNVKDEDDDLSDGERDLATNSSPAPVSYPPQGSPSNVPVDPTADTLVSSTETLLRNIQGLLKVAADNARQQERQISYEKVISNRFGGKKAINNVEVTDGTNKSWPMIKTDEQIDRQDLCTQLMDSIDMKAFTILSGTLPLCDGVTKLAELRCFILGSNALFFIELLLD
ncbi:jg3465 [Pararge aegeria aegeria]|uniref:Jg3465 protein n=1 Tax=Pararge aegeria aegeria TaxID=348720 RepID=A0A8S4R644_9NEOP|nr:jg3465 [Pararge aegeria aegeria]